MSGAPAPDSGQEGARRALALARSALHLLGGWKIALVGAAAIVPALLVVGLFVGAGGAAVGGEGAACTVRGGGAGGIPPEYVPWLQKAATKYKLGARGFAIVAAIHKVESDFGRSTLPGVHSGTNYAGAAGPGQFLSGTWAFYGVDADGDSFRNIYSVPDSVFATANYLRASGAPSDWRTAIFAYNHADWYVEEVLEIANRYSAAEVCEPLGSTQLGEAPAAPLARIEYVARLIETQRIPYCWGGGHGAQPGPSLGSGEFCGPGVRGVDCSGAVRWLLVLSGYPDPGGLRSDQLGAAYPAGRGAEVTIWSNIDHVFLTINGRDWGTSSANFHHGPAFGPQSSAGFAPSHPPGL